VPLVGFPYPLVNQVYHNFRLRAAKFRAEKINFSRADKPAKVITIVPILRVPRGVFSTLFCFLK
jgi:hypothetical protein